MAVLDTTQLLALAQGIAAESERWRHLVRHDAAERIFERLLDGPDVEGWLICWMPGHDTGFHDHDTSSGAVTVLQGQVREQRLCVGRERAVESFYSAGQSFDFSPADIHRVVHAGTDPAVTLHVYSPRIVRPGAYSVSADGLLRRHPVPSDQELRPLKAA